MLRDHRERRSRHMAGSGNSFRLGGREDATTRAGLSEAGFLSHFDGVRQVGPSSWTAKANPDQRTGSVSITQASDGRWLIHDFAGTPTAQLLADRGLSMADLFPERLPAQTPEQRRELRDRARHAQWKAALGVLDREATVVEIAGGYAQRGEALATADRDRLTEALQRIASAKAVLCER